MVKNSNLPRADSSITTCERVVRELLEGLPLPIGVLPAPAICKGLEPRGECVGSKSWRRVWIVSNLSGDLAGSSHLAGSCQGGRGDQPARRVGSEIQEPLRCLFHATVLAPHSGDPQTGFGRRGVVGEFCGQALGIHEIPLARQHHGTEPGDHIGVRR